MSYTSTPDDELAVIAADVGCARCERPFSLTVPDVDAWNGVLNPAGELVGLLCPDCQTPEEDAEATIRDATEDVAIGPDGTAILRPQATS